MNAENDSYEGASLNLHSRCVTCMAPSKASALCVCYFYLCYCLCFANAFDLVLALSPPLSWY